jgi:hypothetical protein
MADVASGFAGFAVVVPVWGIRCTAVSAALKKNSKPNQPINCWCMRPKALSSGQ